MIKYNGQNYLFISSRIRALENTLLSRETLKNMSEARNTAELYALLEENGISGVTDSSGEKSFESSLRELLSTAYGDVLNSVPEPKLFTFFTYPYDCHNLKSAIKCAERGESTDSLLLPYGSIPAVRIEEAVRKRDFSVLPQNMAEAALRAIAGYAKNKNPQDIDLIIDAALFRDMKDSADKNPIRLFSRILTVRADTANILSALRIIKIGGTLSLFKKAFANGGCLPLPFFSAAFEKGISALGESLCFSEGYSALSEAFSDGDADITKAERISEELIATQIRSKRDALAGAETVAGFIAAVEAEVKNVRLLITGKRLMTKAEELFERLCLAYV